MPITTAIKERPIIFSGPMVRAILAGKKTQTRRVVNPQPPSVEDVVAKSGTDYSWFRERPGDRFRVAGPVWAVRELNAAIANLGIKSPCGDVGDRLWVRETFVELHRDHWHESGPIDRLVNNYGRIVRNGFEYKANTDGSIDSERCRKELGYKWKSPIHMPRKASRLTLKIVAVRVERLQAITDADAIREGVDPICFGDDGPEFSAVESFSAEWDYLNSKRGYAWHKNPWVWVIEFKMA